MTDDRFSALSKDPRYRLPSRKEARTVVDPRFQTLFSDPEFSKKASVDRYGRKIKLGNRKKQLEKLYRLENQEKSREVGQEAVGSSQVEEESEDDVGVEAHVDEKDPARDGFSESSSNGGSTSDEEGSEDEAELAEETAGQEQTEDIPVGDVSRRIAAVNLDWDNIRATDIMAVASSFVPSDGEIESVTIYPSDFGRERLEQEDIQGPPPEIFANSQRSQYSNVANHDIDDLEDFEDDEDIKRQLIQNQASEGEEFDTTKLRQYQLERLRYYYAVIQCDSGSTAKALYDSMDGREYLSTANFFDLRFVPNETSFVNDKPRDECTSLPDEYKPNEFRTEALTHSKVRLTWDDDDTTRKEVQKRAFSRAEMDENDLQAYIGSESSDAESVASLKSAAEDRKNQKREAQRSKMRGLLGLSDEPVKSVRSNRDEPVGDMQVTFTSGLGGGNTSKGVFENEPQDEESTRARYIRKERERKQMRKERMKAVRSGSRVDEPKETSAKNEEPACDAVNDNGFDDPFFTDPTASVVAQKKAKKIDNINKREEQSIAESEAAAQRAELELLMANDEADDLRHFDMREIEKTEKEAGRKGKRGKRTKLNGGTAAKGDADAFRVETEDPRFRALFDSHEYAIDPTNPRFKGTEGMKALLEAGRKKRKHVTFENDGAEKKQKRASDGIAGMMS